LAEPRTTRSPRQASTAEATPQARTDADTAAPRTERQRTAPTRRIRTPHGLISIIGGLALWELLVRVFHPDPLIITAPSEIVTTLVDITASGRLWPNFSVSMEGFLIGYVLSALIAVPFGLAVGTNTLLHRYSNPWINALYATPIIGLAPLFVIIFGFGLSAKIAVVVALAIFPMLINTVSGARAVPQEHRELAAVYRATRLETFWRIFLPGSMPFILTGLRLAIGRGLIGVVVADLFGADHGLGLMLQQSAQTFDTPQIFAVTALLAALGIGLTAILETFERRTSRGRN